MRKTKIICTLGPSTDKGDVLRDLIANGMNVARFNFSTPFLNSFRRISGPLVSSRAATGLPSSSRRAFSFARRPPCSS